MTLLPDNIPEHLKNLKTWIHWKGLDSNGKLQKIPCDPDFLNINPLAPSNHKSFKSASKQSKDKLGLGFVFMPENNITGIDLDDCFESDGSLKLYAKEIVELLNSYTEISPSNKGLHIYIYSTKHTNKSTKGIEIYARGRYFTVTGDTYLTYNNFNTSEQSKNIEHIVAKYCNVEPKNQPTTYLELLANTQPLADWDTKRIKDELIPLIKSHYDIESYESWLRLGMALHHQGKGDMNYLNLWDEISSPGSTYNYAVLYDKWLSFKDQSHGPLGNITLASIIKFCSEAESKESFGRVEHYIKLIKSEREASNILDSIMPTIKNDKSLTPLLRNSLANQIVISFKKLGVPTKLRDIEKALFPSFETNKIPEWLEDWAYLTHEDSFINIKTKQKIKERAFNAMYTREIGGLSIQITPADLALNHYNIPTPSKVVYIPWGEPLLELNGESCVNSYIAPPSPPAKMDWDVVEEQSNIMLNHINLLFGHDKESTNTLLNWIAYNVQNPGRKITWCPLIKGMQGDGKTIISELLRSLMGFQNVGIIDASAIESSFTAWAAGKAINVLEEVRIAGKNRHEIMNKLKPLITNDCISVQPKYVDPYIVPNVTNYIAFTNHVDALPVDDNERRFWIKFTPYNTNKDLITAGLNEEHFQKVYEAIRTRPNELRAFFLNFPIQPNFKPYGRAPESEDKSLMAITSQNDETTALLDILEDETPNINKNFISTKHLTTAMEVNYNVNIKGQSVARLLLQFGYKKHPKKIRLGDTVTTLWLHKDCKLSVDKIKEILK